MGREGDLMMPLEHWHIECCEVASHSIKRNCMIWDWNNWCLTLYIFVIWSLSNKNIKAFVTISDRIMCSAVLPMLDWSWHCFEAWTCMWCTFRPFCGGLRIFSWTAHWCSFPPSLLKHCELQPSENKMPLPMRPIGNVAEDWCTLAGWALSKQPYI